MPTYVYKFVDTGETIEVQQSFDDPTLTETSHPVTGATMPVKKVFQPVGVTFRGTGFYKTDSRGGKSSSSSTASSSSDGAKSDGAKTDSPKSDSAKSESSSPTSTTPASTKSAPSD